MCATTGDEDVFAENQVTYGYPARVISEAQRSAQLLQAALGDGSEPFASLLTVAPELYDRTITINGCSKAYAMTGWRIGYCGGPKEIVTAMTTIQGQSTSNASSISQKAAVAALTGDQRCVADMIRAFKERHDYVVGALNGLPGVSCLPGAGTFYAFADVRGVDEREAAPRHCSNFQIEG